MKAYLDVPQLEAFMRRDLARSLRMIADTLDDRAVEGHFVGTASDGFHCSNDEMRLLISFRLRLRPIQEWDIPPGLPAGDASMVATGPAVLDAEVGTRSYL
jgi:hypothetical protein